MGGVVSASSRKRSVQSASSIVQRRHQINQHQQHRSWNGEKSAPRTRSPPTGPQPGFQNTSVHHTTAFNSNERAIRHSEADRFFGRSSGAAVRASVQSGTGMSAALSAAVKDLQHSTQRGDVFTPPQYGKFNDLCIFWHLILQFVYRSAASRRETN